MTYITLPVGSLIKINSASLSEHNRGPLSISYNRIEKAQRMSNGLLRKFFIADKKSLTVSWNMLPSYSSYTVDGGYGALDLKNFYETNVGSFPVTISFGPISGGTSETISMVFSSFNCELMKRNVFSEVVYEESNITAATISGSSITYTGNNSFKVGDSISVSGFDTDIYNVNRATIVSRNSTSFTVTKSGSTASVTEASSNGTVFTYYANNTFSAGDVVSITGFNTKTITAASSASGNITYTSTAHGFLVGDIVNISGVNVADVEVSPYNLSNAKITSKDDNTFTVAGTATGTPVFSSAQATSVYNKTNVDIISAEDYYFNIADTLDPITNVLSTPGTALLGNEITRFSVTKFEPTLNTNVKYTAANHDLEVGDVVSISGIRSTATITGAAAHTTAGQIKYIAANTFKAGDIISITGITPSSYNLNNVEVVSATTSQFIVANPTTEKYRKGGSSSSIFNLSNVTISAVTKNTFTVPFTSASGLAVSELSGVTVGKSVNYRAKANTISAAPQEFWTVSLSLEQV